MSGILARLGARGRHGGANAVVHLARETVGRRRTLAGAIQEVRNPGILDALADEDFRVLDTTIAERQTSDREFSLTLARLSHAAARAKGFDRQLVDAALRLDSLVPSDDPQREREKLLRDAYGAAQRASYVRGGRRALGRLGRIAVETGDLDRAQVLLQQQLDLGPEKDDSPAEVDSALVLGDIHRQHGDHDAAQTLYRRAGQTSQRLEYHRGTAEALVRQIELTPPDQLETVAALQRQGLDAARRTSDVQLEGRILIGLAETLSTSGRLDDAAAQFEACLQLARDTGDLALEASCVTTLARIYRELGRGREAVTAERDSLAIEERLGNRTAAADWAIKLAQSEMAAGRLDSAADAYDRARLLAAQLGDSALEQRAEGGLGIAYTLLRQPADALDHLMRALDLARAARDDRHVAQWLASISQALWNFGEPDEAARATVQAIDAAQDANDIEIEASMFTLLGQIHASRRETIRARDCFTRALDLNRDLNQTAEQITALTALATLAADTGQFTQATALYEQALSLVTNTGDRVTASRLHGRMGRLLQKRGDLRAARDEFHRSVDLAETSSDPRLLSQALQHLATAMDLAGDTSAADTYRRAMSAAALAGDHRGEITMRVNFCALLTVRDGMNAVTEGIEILSRAIEQAERLGPEGQDLLDRADQLLDAALAKQAREQSRARYRSDYQDPRKQTADVADGSRREREREPRYDDNEYRAPNTYDDRADDARPYALDDQDDHGYDDRGGYADDHDDDIRYADESDDLRYPTTVRGRGDSRADPQYWEEEWGDDLDLPDDDEPYGRDSSGRGATARSPAEQDDTDRYADDYEPYDDDHDDWESDRDGSYQAASPRYAADDHYADDDQWDDEWDDPDDHWEAAPPARRRSAEIDLRSAANRLLRRDQRTDTYDRERPRLPSWLKRPGESDRQTRSRSRNDDELWDETTLPPG